MGLARWATKRQERLKKTLSPSELVQPGLSQLIESLKLRPRDWKPRGSKPRGWRPRELLRQKLLLRRKGLKTRETHCLRLKGSRLLDSRLKQQQQRTRRSTLSLRLSPRFNRSSHRPS